MPNWKQTLDISADWQLAKNREITAQQLAGRIAAKLKKFKLDEILEEIIEQFEDFATEEGVDFNDFDYLMDELYNWSDENHNCWVKVI